MTYGVLSIECWTKYEYQFENKKYVSVMNGSLKENWKSM